MSIFCMLFVTGIQLLFAYLENHVDIWLVILFLIRKKFHAKQIFLLSISMKLGLGPHHTPLSPNHTIPQMTKQ